MAKQDSTELVVTQALNPVVVYGEGGVDAILERVRQEALAAKTDDISTADNRAKIASLAYKVARSKTALDDMGKTLAATLRSQVTAIDTDRKRIRDNLDALKDEVRKPLTDWETAEKVRTDAHEAALALIQGASVGFLGEPTVAQIDERIAGLEQNFKRDWQEFTARAHYQKAQIHTQLDQMRVVAVKRDAERAEMARLQREEAERVQRERDAKIAAEAAASAKREAEAKAKEAARIAAQKAQEAIDREKARVRKAKEDAEAAAAKAESDKKAAVEAERKRVAAQQAKADAEAEKRETNKRNRARIKKAVIAQLIGLHLSDEDANTVFEAIAADEVPHVKIEW